MSFVQIELTLVWLFWLNFGLSRYLCRYSDRSFGLSQLTETKTSI